MLSAVKKNKFWLKFLSLLISVFVMSGCGLLGNGIQEGSRGDAGDIPKIGLVTEEGGIDDPFYQKVWDGLMRAEQELNVGIGYIKAKSNKDYPAKIAELANKDYQLIITMGSNAIPAVLEAAPQNPKTMYLCINSSLSDQIPSNVLSVTYKIEEASFLAGFLAGKMTKSRVVGFISGDNKDLSLRCFYGYKAGLRQVSSGTELLKGLAGTFTNKNRLKIMTESMLSSKADVILFAAGSAGKSMAEVVAKAGKYSIGAYEDQKIQDSDNILTAVIIKHDDVIYELLEEFKAGTLAFGVNRGIGLAQNAVALAESAPGVIPDVVHKQMLDYRDKIIAGKLVIPASENEYLNSAAN